MWPDGQALDSLPGRCAEHATQFCSMRAASHYASIWLQRAEAAEIGQVAEISCAICQTAYSGKGERSRGLIALDIALDELRVDPALALWACSCLLGLPRLDVPAPLHLVLPRLPQPHSVSAR